MQLRDLQNYIGSLLDVERFRDYCPNGLQVEGKSEVLRIATAVTASQAVIEAASQWQADALLVHHGFFWRNEEAAIVGMKKRRIAHLLKNDMSLLAYHLPLDTHPELGNNAQLARRLGWTEDGRFGDQNIASYGVLDQQQTLLQLQRQVAGELGQMPLVVGDLNKSVRRVAWCSVGAQGYFEQGIALNVDVFMSGEISEQQVHIAHETGVAFIAAGHYATEQFGVQALGAHLAQQFPITHQFFKQEIPV